MSPGRRAGALRPVRRPVAIESANLVAEHFLHAVLGYEQVRDRAIDAVRQRKRSALAQRAAQRMKMAYQIQVVPEGAAFMSERLKPKTEDLLHTNTPPDPNTNRRFL